MPLYERNVLLDKDDGKEQIKFPIFSFYPRAARVVCRGSVNTLKALEIQLGIPLWASLYIPSSLMQNALPRHTPTAELCLTAPLLRNTLLLLAWTGDQTGGLF